MKCNHCGWDNLEEAKFCNKCGKKLEPDEAAKNQKNISGIRPGFKIAAVVAALAVVVFIGLSVFQGDGSVSTTEKQNSTAVATPVQPEDAVISEGDTTISHDMTVADNATEADISEATTDNTSDDEDITENNISEDGSGDKKTDQDATGNADGKGSVFDQYKLFDTDFYNDKYFKQMNTVIFVEEDIYSDSRLSREISLDQVNLYADTYDHKTVDDSHILSSYIAPILDNGYSYMSLYDYTYCWDNDDQVEYFMSIIDANAHVWKTGHSTTEYQELIDVYDEYKGGKFDVNPYIAHYITFAFDRNFGAYVFDADFYKETYPVLAYLYEYDDKALAQHFYTIGMYEGRQGCEDFNVNAYMSAEYSASSDYKNNENIAKYYVEYALDRAAGSTQIYPATSTSKLQLRLYDPCFDTYLESVNEYRVKEGLSEYQILSVYDQAEANALANFRARYDALDRMANAHELAPDCGRQLYSDGIITRTTYVKGISENKYTQRSEAYSDSTHLSGTFGVNYALNNAYDLAVNETMSSAWIKSTSHYKAAAQESRNIYTAQSHIYANRCTDIYVDDDHMQKYSEYGDDTTFRIVFALYFKNDDIFGTSNE